MLKNNFFSTVFLSWLVFVTFCSLFSFSDFETENYITLPYFDKVVHFIFYFVTCVLGVLFIREKTKGEMSLVKTLVITCVVTIIFGGIIEILQFAITVERMADVFDGLANSLGSLCGALSMKFLFLEKRQLKWKY